MTTVTRADVEQAPGRVVDEPPVVAGPGPGPQLDQQPGHPSVVLVIGVVVVGIERWEFRLHWPGVEKLRSAGLARLDDEGPERDDEVLEINHVGAEHPGS